MSKIASTSLAPCHHGDRWRVKLMQHHQQPQWQCHATTKSEKRSSSQPLMVKNQMAVKPATYSSRIATDIPLYESPGVCLPFCFNSLIFLFSVFAISCGVALWLVFMSQALFDQYLEDKPRVFNAMFPDNKQRSQRLNEVSNFGFVFDFTVYGSGILDQFCLQLCAYNEFCSIIPS